MNVLHINQSDIGGGTAIAGYRLHEGLLAQDLSKITLKKLHTRRLMNSCARRDL
jgi:branched-subunit amino acid aminotransferase/4-amino-4-deoxychorismate lyase